MQNDLEHFSASHDGEGNLQDLLGLLDDIDSNADARERHALYHLIGDAMRNPDSPVLTTDVTAAVMRSVAREAVPSIPADASIHTLNVRRRSSIKTPATWIRALSGSFAAAAAVAFVSSMIWKFSAVNTDPVVAYVVFEQPRAQGQVVQMDSMPPELVDYLLAHRQNSAAGSMNAGSSLIRANVGEPARLSDPQVLAKPKQGDMEWVRLWDSRPVYVNSHAVER